MRQTVILKFDNPKDGAGWPVPGIAVLEIDGTRVLHPVLITATANVRGFDFTATIDGACVGLVGELPNLDFVLDAVNARKSPR